MTKLDEMWTALAAYQPKADADGHGVSWAKMCSKRTSDAAVGAAYSYGVTYAAARAADFAARAADFAAASAADDYYAAAADYAARAIEYIKEALAQQDAETNLQAVSDFGQLQAQPAQERCTHGVWAADHCYKCAASQPEQEPVACDCRLQADECNGVTATFHPFQVGASCSTSPCERVYTSPPKCEWVGLTSEEHQWIKDLEWTTDELVNWIEAKLKELNA